MKKTAFLVSIIMFFFTLTLCINVSAEKDINQTQINLSCKTLENDLIISDDICIPAGSEEIAINIDDNYGYIAAEFQIDLQGTEVIKDKNNQIVITPNNTYGTSISSAVQNGNSLYIATVSNSSVRDNGTVLTVYATKKPKFMQLNKVSTYKSYEDIISTKVINNSISSQSANMKQSINSSRNAYVFHTTIGDANGDGIVDIADATIALTAVSKASDLNLTHQLSSGEIYVTSSDFDQNITTLLASFSNITFLNYSTRVIVCSSSFDGNKDGKISDNIDNSDVQQILNYYMAYLSETIYNNPGWYIGDTIPVIVNA